MNRCALLCLISCLLIYRVGTSQNDKYGVPFIRSALSFGQFAYQHQFHEESFQNDSLVYTLGDRQYAGNGGLALHVEGGYCFAFPLRVGIQWKSRVYAESTTSLSGIYLWHSVGPLFEFYVRPRLGLQARAYYAWDSQFRSAENKFSWGSGLGMRYFFEEYPHLAVLFDIDYLTSQGHVVRIHNDGNLSQPVQTRTSIQIKNRGAMIQIGLIAEF